MIKVSVHIVTFNSEAHIKDCLQAVLAQSYPIEQIIVIDNDSKDTTMEFLQFYEQQITLVINSINIGFAAAHNQAIQLATSDYHLVLNPDVTLHSDYLFQLINYLIDHPQVGSATGKLLFKVPPHAIDSTGLRMTKARRAYDEGAGLAAELKDSSQEVFGVSAAAALYSRSMVDHISIDKQFFDEDFFAYKEDVDVAWRAQLLGWSAIYLPLAIGFHERGWKAGARDEQPIFIRKHSYINRYRMMFKNESFSYLTRQLPYYLLYELMSFGYILFKEPVLLSAWAAFFKDMPSLRRKRRTIQAKRKVEYRDVYAYFQN